MIILVGPAIQPCDNNNNSNNNEACNAPIPIRTRQFRRRVGAVKGKKDKLMYYTQPEEGGWGEALVENWIVLCWSFVVALGYCQSFLLNF